MGQEIAGKKLPFSDHDAVRRAMPSEAAGATGVLWTPDELLTVTQGRLIGAFARPVTGLSIDSRTIQPGDAFLAIKGTRSDGHVHVADALERGGSVALVDADKAGGLAISARPLLAVERVLDALERMAQAARARSRARIVAVTGSVGKTSTKEALAAALAPSGRTHAAAASFNNHLGVPLTLASMDRATAFAVFEIGMNHAGEIRPLAKLVKPHVAIITTIAPAHLEHLGSMRGIVDAKAEIFEGLEPGGTAILNRDNEWFGTLAEIAGRLGIRVIGFGAAAEADARLIKFVLKEDCSAVTADILGETITYKMSVPGRHLVDNSLAVLAAVKVLGADLARAGLALGQIRQPKGRGVRHELQIGDGTAVLIDESYNANPTSMRAALALLAQAPPSRRRVAVLGDMLELGPDTVETHRALLQPILDAGVDRVYCCGPLMKGLWNALPHSIRGAHAEVSEGLLPLLEEDLKAGDIVMVKGSLGSRMGPVVEKLVARFAIGDDAAAV